MFKHDDLTLRVLEEGDIERVRALRNDPTTWVYLTDPHPITKAGQKQWFTGLLQRTDRMYFVMQDKKHPFIGMVRMDEYDRTNRSIRVGADVAPKLRGKGYGHKAMEAIQAYCFGQLNMHRVWLAVLETNVRAHHLYESHGFKEEGRLRDAVFRDGEYHDYILMSILEEEYRK